MNLCEFLIRTGASPVTYPNRTIFDGLHFDLRPCHNFMFIRRNRGIDSLKLSTPLAVIVFTCYCPSGLLPWST